MPILEQLRKYAPLPRQAGTKKWDVFLSYRSVDRTWVLSLYDVLTELGYKVFLDQYVLKAGDLLINQLEDGLENSQAGVLIWSNATADSKWVNQEYNTLQRKATTEPDFIFVPVKLDGTELPSFAKNRIYADFTTYPDGPNGGELLRLLYAIDNNPLPGNAVDFANDLNDTAKSAAAKVRAAISQNRPEKLLQLYKEGGVAWETSPSLGCQAAHALIKLKKYTEAIEILDDLKKKFTRSIRPLQLKALALAKRGGDGDLDNAQDILGELYESNHLDPETAGIYARTFMDRCEKTGDIQFLKQSREIYARAFELTPTDYYTGINAAAKSVFIGTQKDVQAGLEYAGKVLAITGDKPVAGDYWKTATIAEAFLIQKKFKKAADMYEQAIAMARTEIDSHESTYKQAKRLMEKLLPTEEERAMIIEEFKHLQKAI